jgi:type I protein arginine methyltransferase
MSPTKLLRAAIRSLRWLKRKFLSHHAFRDFREELLYGDFTSEDQISHEMLLADAIRMNAYRAAIRRNVKAGDVVVDLGTGTGILSMLAAQQNPKIVHAIDYSNIITMAERIASANHFTNITFHNIGSRRFMLDEPVDVILHELIGRALLDEGMVQKTLDLKKRLLKASGQILPGKFEVFLEPVCVNNDHRIPFLWETMIPGIDFSSVKEVPENDKFKLYDRDWRVSPRSAIDYFLCDPSPILAFDLNKINDPSEIPKAVSASRTVRRSGRMDGFLFYFRVIFDAEVEFDTSPFSPRTDWDGLHFRLESREYHQGETIAYTLEMKDPYDYQSWIVQITNPGI